LKASLYINNSPLKIVMRLKKLSIIMIPLILIGCVNITSKNKHNGDILSTALSGFMALDKVTSVKTIKVISVDLSNISNIKDSDKSAIINELQKKSHAEIRFDSLAKLESQGLYDKEHKNINGVLFTINKINKIDENKYNINTTIYSSGDASAEAICSIEYLNGVWKIIKTEVPKAPDSKG
jgi:hypothetical protein